jgi:hypothetical protein
MRMKLTRAQQAHEALIESAYQGLVGASTREEREAFSNQMVRLIHQRDPAVTLRMERQRLDRAGRR